MTVVNVVNVSGGKDSTATALVACEQAEGDLRFVFADTGHEHWRTYEYLEYLDQELRDRVGVGITRVRADFSRQLEYRRKHLTRKWGTPKSCLIGDRLCPEPTHTVKLRLHRIVDPESLDGALVVDQEDPLLGLLTEDGKWRFAPQIGIPLSRIRRVIWSLFPTGNPMLDLCKLRGRFPSQRARFCTQELKVFPVQKQIVQPLADEYDAVIMWHGVRRDESASRAMLEPRSIELGTWEPEPQGILIYRPVLEWTPDDVFAKHREAGVRWNPLYEEGMGRVGCAPCIHARKAELGEWARRYPEIFDHLAYMEEWVSKASKRGISTFFAQDKTPGDPNDWTRSSAYKVKDWATHGGQDRLFDLNETGALACTSVYGLCE